MPQKCNQQIIIATTQIKLISKIEVVAGTESLISAIAIKRISIT